MADVGASLSQILSERLQSIQTTTQEGAPSGRLLDQQGVTPTPDPAPLIRRGQIGRPAMAADLELLIVLGYKRVKMTWQADPMEFNRQFDICRVWQRGTRANAVACLAGIFRCRCRS